MLESDYVKLKVDYEKVVDELAKEKASLRSTIEKLNQAHKAEMRKEKERCDNQEVNCKKAIEEVKENYPLQRLKEVKFLIEGNYLAMEALNEIVNRKRHPKFYEGSELPQLTDPDSELQKVLYTLSKDDLIQGNAEYSNGEFSYFKTAKLTSTGLILDFLIQENINSRLN